MSATNALVFVLGMLLIAYPLYYLMSKPNTRKRQFLGLWLMFFAVAALAWPRGDTPLVTTCASLLGVGGFGLYLDLFRRNLMVLLPLVYGVILLTWPEPLGLAALVLGALLTIASFGVAVGFGGELAANEDHHG
jgi:hypothetical protein